MNNKARQNYRGNRFRGDFRGYGRQNSRESYRNERYGNNNRIGIDKGKEFLQELMGETEALAMIGPDQGPELVQIGIGYGAMHVENMTIFERLS